MYDLALVTAHGLEVDLLPDAARLVREMSREACERLLTARTIVLDIEDDARIARLRDLVDDKIGEILQGIEGCAVFTDENAEVLPLHVEYHACLAVHPMQGNIEVHCGKDLTEKAFCGADHLVRERNKLTIRTLAAAASIIAAIAMLPSVAALIYALRRRIASAPSLAIAPAAAFARPTTFLAALRPALRRILSRGGAQIRVKSLWTDAEAIVCTRLLARIHAG